MNRNESERKSFGEKAIWWAKVGGITAAVLGAIRHIAEVTNAGILVTVGAFAAEGLIYRRPKTA